METTVGRVIYSDVNAQVKERSSDILIYNEDTINASLETIFSTPIKNRPFRRPFGCRLRSLLFEPFDQQTADAIGAELKEAAKTWELRITDIQVVSIADRQNQNYHISVSYKIPKLNDIVGNYTFTAEPKGA